MWVIVLILVAALITLLTVNRMLLSDLKHYTQHYTDLLETSKRLHAQFAQDRDVDGERLATQADRLVKLRKQCAAISQKVKPQIALMRVMLDSLEAVVPERYVCPKCMCSWRDNGDGTMSLFDETFKSCEFCETAPLNALDLVRSDGVVIADAIPRQDIQAVPRQDA
jgi:hypothetical protein